VTVTLLVVAAALAVGDWVAVAQRLFRVEYLLKPATLAVLIGAASTADLAPAVKPWVIVALVCGLLGDIGLMLSADEDADPPFLAGALVVIGVAALALPRVLRGATRAAGRPFGYVVAGYAAVLAAMAVLAVGTGQVATAIGGVLFLASDALIAHDRFVARVWRGPLLVIISYHLAQFLILIGLIRSF
jgi:uncharacterized membrane protein YhhN